MEFAIQSPERSGSDVVKRRRNLMRKLSSRFISAALVENELFLKGVDASNPRVVERIPECSNVHLAQETIEVTNALPEPKSVEVSVAFHGAKLLVGTDGYLISKIEKDTSTYILTPFLWTVHPAVVFNIIGSPDNVQRAQRTIQDLISWFRRQTLPQNLI